MHWNQYASPRQQREWSRIQAELNATHIQEYEVSTNELRASASTSISGLALEIAERIRDSLETKWHGTKPAIVVRILLPDIEVFQDARPTTSLRIYRLEPWTAEQSAIADRTVAGKLKLTTRSESEGPFEGWRGMEGVYTGTAEDDTWRSAVGLGGGKPWGSRRQL